MHETSLNEISFSRVQVSRGSCYGSPALTVEMKFETGEKVLCEFTEEFKKKNILLDRSVVENFLTKIFEIIEKEEVLTDLRHVEVRYHAEIEWENLNSINGERSGKLKLFSNEWHTEEIEEFIQFEAETAETAERFQKILDQKPHRHALEIYRAVKGFARKYLIKTNERRNF